MILLQWTLCYALVAALATAIKSRFTDLRYSILVMHVGIAVSIVCMQLAGFSLEWSVSPFALGAVFAALLCAGLLIGPKSALYAASSLLQEWCILLAGSHLALRFDTAVSAVATALVFAFAHRMPREQLSWKLPLLFTWGVISIFLYQYVHAPLLNVAIHLIGGSIFIERGLLVNEY
jgi:hypothetical protein